MHYFEGLNERQKEAVETTDGPLLILAGAGAGKTKTVTHRILHLMHQGVAPHQILAITFTNKAAKEMRERVVKLMEQDATLGASGVPMEKPMLSTFHSLGVHILKENSRRLGLSRHFAIFDRTDSISTIKEALNIVGLDPKQYEPGKILSAISRQKGNGLSQKKYAEQSGKEFFPRMVASVWEKYEDALKKESALDFDDLLLKTYELLRDVPEVLEHYHNTWKYIHIDEYQDTNKVQYDLARLLAKKHRNICTVGDIDQSIYSWRGADIENILRFEKDYPEAKIVLLEENYRSTQIILSAANEIIKKNTKRREKNLFTRNGEGHKIRLHGGYDEVDEATYIAKEAKKLIQEGVPPKEMAVLYRANFQSRVLEEAFLSASVPYQVLGVRFFDRKEVKDLLAYIRLALNPQSAADLRRAITTPSRGIGKVSLLKILSNQESELPAAMRAKLAQFWATITAIRENIGTGLTSTSVRFAITESGMEEFHKKDGAEGEERIQNLKELVTLAIKYDSLPAEEGIEAFLADAALASDQDEMKEETNAVRLMTVHASKGLEFDCVFISGLEEDLFPHQRFNAGTSRSLSEEEEERRLFYVAVTRARKRLYLTYASMRTIFGSRQINTPSQFITDIDPEIIEEDNARPSGGKVVYLEID